MKYYKITLKNGFEFETKILEKLQTIAPYSEIESSEELGEYLAKLENNLKQLLFRAQ